jgi:hypothetical protein
MFVKCRCAFLIFISFSSLYANIEIGFQKENASLDFLRQDKQNISFQQGEGGFQAIDVETKQVIKFNNSKLDTLESGKLSFTGQNKNISIRAAFSIKDDFVIVNGVLENLNADDRAIILQYILPVSSSGTAFSNGLNHTVPMDSDYEGNVYPVQAVCNVENKEEWGIALAIPPNSPAIFGMACSKSGAQVNYYLGLSPQTKEFPNKANFSFIIYTVDPQWGFRSAMEKYYALYPEYYSCRTNYDGLWMFQMEGKTPSNVRDYGFNELSMGSPTITQDIERDEKYKILTFPYMIVGQREIKNLESLPASYKDAMNVFDKWKIPEKRTIAKENVASSGDINLRTEVTSSACKKKNGEYNIVIRNTPWGNNSITFKANPNPSLLVGHNALNLIKEWLEKYKSFDGIYIDSLGAMWPAILNYNKSHFKYAQYPLTFGPEGTVALHNQISHYEFLESLRSTLNKQNKLLFANGIYCYPCKRRAPEHYKANKLGRFFEAALLDIAGSEQGINLNQERWEFYRASMAKKVYMTLNYKWENQDDVEKLLNKALCYAVFATNAKNHQGVDYVGNQNGYLRDKELMQKFVKNVRILSRAGWEPVTHAAIDVEDVHCERYGHGDEVYFALLNETSADVDCKLSLEYTSLGFTADDSSIEEIVYGSPFEVEGNDIVITLEPYKTLIIKISKSWMLG